MSSAKIQAEEFSEEKVLREKVRISDAKFMRRLRYVMDGRDLLLDCNSTIPPADLVALDLGHLVWVRSSFIGRRAHPNEWLKLEMAQRALMRHLTPTLLLMLRTQRSRQIITWLPLYLLAFAISGLVIASLSPVISSFLNSIFGLEVPPFTSRLTGYLLWTLSLGGLGAAASLGVNALAIRTDATFDVNDQALVVLRLVVGAVFAFVIALVFSWNSFAQFISMLQAATSVAPSETTRPSPNSLDIAGLLLLPFLLGFSTPLVLTILERFIVSVETFFGARVAVPSGRVDSGTGAVAAAAATGAAAGTKEVKEAAKAN